MENKRHPEYDACYSMNIPVVSGEPNATNNKQNYLTIQMSKRSPLNLSKGYLLLFNKVIPMNTCNHVPKNRNLIL